MSLIYLAIIFLSGQMNPLSFAKKVGRVQFSAFSTSSTVAIIPSIETARNRLKVPESVSELVIPLCTIMTMVHFL